MTVLAGQVQQVVMVEPEPVDHEVPVHLSLVAGHHRLDEAVNLLGGQGPASLLCCDDTILGD